MRAALNTVHVLSAGAAQGLAHALQPELAAHGLALVGQFGAVGSMRELLVAGSPCDVFISTLAQLQALAKQGLLDGAGIRSLGTVATGLAVRAGQAAPAIHDAHALCTALLAAPEIHCPDMAQSTAGVHVAKVLAALGIGAEVASRLHVHPNGMTAMAALAASSRPAAVGCTQITEILSSPGVDCAGDLPAPLQLHTVYAVALVQGTPRSQWALRAQEVLTGDAAQALRMRFGFAGSGAGEGLA